MRLLSHKIPLQFLRSHIGGQNLWHPISTATETRSQKLERIADELLDLNKLERYDYSVLFQYRLGLNRYGPAVSGVDSSGRLSASSPEAAGAKPAVEKTTFDVKLEKYDAAAKIKVIKEVRAFTALGLKEAKDLVEKAPVVLKTGVTKEEANQILEKLKELGATEQFKSSSGLPRNLLVSNRLMELLLGIS